MIAKLDARDEYAEATAHARETWHICVIAGRPERFLELLERSIDGAAVTEALFVEAFGPRPAGPPFPDLFWHPGPRPEDW